MRPLNALVGRRVRNIPAMALTLHLDAKSILAKFQVTAALVTLILSVAISQYGFIA